jgi:hypothetical protein
MGTVTTIREYIQRKNERTQSATPNRGATDDSRVLMLIEKGRIVAEIPLATPPGPECA